MEGPGVWETIAAHTVGGIFLAVVVMAIWERIADR